MVEEKSIKESLIQRLFAAGAHFGFSKSRTHPSTRPYLYGFKNRYGIIDLRHTAEQLARACDFVRGLAREGKEILLIGNKDEAKEIVRQAAEGLGVPYVASRWLGGTFTNWPQIKSRIERLKDLKSKRENKELSVYTKKERLLFDREISRLERYLNNLSGLAKLPAVVILIDPRQENIVVREARRTGIAVVALSGSDCDLRGIDYPVVANDANVESIRFFIDQLAAAYRDGQTAAAEIKTELAPAPVVAENKNG